MSGSEHVQVAKSVGREQVRSRKGMGREKVSREKTNTPHLRPLRSLRLLFRPRVQMYAF